MSYRVPERVRERYEGNSNNGGDCDFYTCLTCGTPVLPDSRELHDEWHRRIDANAAHPVTADRFSRLTDQELMDENRRRIMRFLGAD